MQAPGARRAHRGVLGEVKEETGGFAAAVGQEQTGGPSPFLEWRYTRCYCVLKVLKKVAICSGPGLACANKTKVLRHNGGGGSEERKAQDGFAGVAGAAGR